jgi:integrase
MPASLETFADLIELHFADLAELGRPLGRSKESALLRLKDDPLGATRISHINRDILLQFAKRRAKQGAGPVTIGTILEHAAAVHCTAVPSEQMRRVRIALDRLGLAAKSAERDRCPTPDGLEAIIMASESELRLIIPLARLVKFAVATAMRQDEICRVQFEDFNAQQSTLMIRQRKHPRQKTSNDQVIPLVADAGQDLAVLIAE